MQQTQHILIDVLYMSLHGRTHRISALSRYARAKMPCRVIRLTYFLLLPV